MSKRRTSKTPRKPTPTKRHVAASPAPASVPAGPPIKRTVDLGREEELVTWNEWLERSSLAMSKLIPSEQHERLAFRVTLADRRRFIVRQVVSHVARGTCTIAPSRWNEREAICDVITGYMFIGIADDGSPSTLCVPPSVIRALECLLLPEDQPDAPSHPFGFYKRDDLSPLPHRSEVEETFASAVRAGAD